MIPPLDVFEEDSQTKDLQWLGAANDLEDAQRLILTRGAKPLRVYIVHSQVTGKRTFFKFENERLASIPKGAERGPLQ
jgi:hypothetical protein